MSYPDYRHADKQMGGKNASFNFNDRGIDGAQVAQEDQQNETTAQDYSIRMYQDNYKA